MKTVWKDIPDFGGRYAVSNTGEISNKNTGRILKAWCDSSGYRKVALCQGGFCKQAFVHRLVADAFVSRNGERLEVNHKDGDKNNNNADNLEWCTRSENLAHSYRVLHRKWNAGRPRVKVLCVETGEVFDSIVEAARAKGVDSRNLHAVISPKSYKKTCGGYHWKKYV